MILKGNQRGGAKQLALHLLNDHDNEHVEIHSVNGFMASDLTGALTEMYAMSRATKCTQFMFSLSLSPPKNEIVPIEDFENAIDQAAEKLGLANQPRVVLFHEKKGRRHCHVVFSRIDTDVMKAVNLPFYKERLYELSRELYLTHGWEMPKGLQDRALSDPLNYSLEEYQVAMRAKRDPREIKATLQKCWQQSDGKKAFAAALEEKGFYLCKGDRRGIVAVHWHDPSIVYSLSRWTGEKLKTLKAKLGETENLPSLDETREKMARKMTEKYHQFRAHIQSEFERKMAPLEHQHKRTIKRHREERIHLIARQKNRQKQEAIERSKRLRKGLLGMWDWMIGKRQKILHQITEELERCRQKDLLILFALKKEQGQQRRELQHRHERIINCHKSVLFDFNSEFNNWRDCLFDQENSHIEKKQEQQVNFEPTVQ